MNQKLLFLFIFIPVFLYSQFSVSGKINSGDNYSWILLYKLENGEQKFVSNTNVENGEFQFKIAETEPSGIYRAFYQIENNLYVEFIYNKENINFTFDAYNPIESISFSSSEENIINQNYYNAITSKQRELDSLQIVFFNSNETKINKKLGKTYRKRLEEKNTIQINFEKKSEGTIANHFIKASKQYNSKTPIKIPEDYLNEIKIHFFDAVNFNDTILINSTFINDKIMDYIFYLNQNKDLKALNEMQKESINLSLSKITSNTVFKKNVEENILKQFAKEQNAEMVNFVIENHYNKLPKSLQDLALKYKVLADVKTAIGKAAPDIKWTENGVNKNLYSLIGFDYYIVVFFSSTCPHCQTELPEFYNQIKNFANVRVIAIGIEDEKTGWENMTNGLSGFIHILDLEKWKSTRVKDYGVTAIPSYFILDSNKKIIAKPNDVEELKEMFEAKK